MATNVISTAIHDPEPQQHAQSATRFLVIRPGQSQSVCTVVCRGTRNVGSAIQQYGPYELPLCNSVSTSLHPSTSTDKALSLEMQGDGEHSGPQLPPHAYVKLRMSCLMQHSTKVMEIGRLADDDQLLLQELWEDANSGYMSPEAVAE